MKSYTIFIFFSIVSVIYFLVNWYVVSRGIKALEGSSYTNIFKWSYWLLVVSFIVGQILERGEPTLIGRVVTHIGSIWLSVFLYLLIFVVIVDIFRMINHFWHFFPEQISSITSNGKLLFATGWMIAFFITGIGYINARYPRINEVEIELDKSMIGSDEIKVVLASDIHMGAIIGKKRVREMVEKINSQNPDLVIFAGDLVDHNPLFVKSGNIGPEFLKIKAPMGVYAVAGNHEFIGHAEVSINYLQKYGIKYLRDTSILVDGKIQIIGRDDREKKQHEGNARKSFDEVIKGVNKELPTILIDHQPVEYSSAQNFGVDLMVSGHTHKGQLWPFGFVTKKVFENDYGLIRKGKTWFYTSSGYGTWGPPVRTGNRPELVVFKIKANNNSR